MEKEPLVFSNGKLNNEDIKLNNSELEYQYTFFIEKETL